MVEERTAELAEATREAQQARGAADEANEAKSSFLANNAVKFTESGEIVVSAHLSRPWLPQEKKA